MGQGGFVSAAATHLFAADVGEGDAGVGDGGVLELVAVLVALAVADEDDPRREHPEVLGGRARGGRVEARVEAAEVPPVADGGRGGPGPGALPAVEGRDEPRGGGGGGGGGAVCACDDGGSGRDPGVGSGLKVADQLPLLEDHGFEVVDLGLELLDVVDGVGVRVLLEVEHRRLVR